MCIRDSQNTPVHPVKSYTPSVQGEGLETRANVSANPSFQNTCEVGQVNSNTATATSSTELDDSSQAITQNLVREADGSILTANDMNQKYSNQQQLGQLQQLQHQKQQQLQQQEQSCQSPSSEVLQIVSQSMVVRLIGSTTGSVMKGFNKTHPFSFICNGNNDFRT